MPVTVLVGAQWGDEGKGKIVDLLAPDAAIVARYQGGANAGHTIVRDGERFAFHLLPSGILHEGVACALGPGVVIDVDTLAGEVAALDGIAPPVAGRLHVAPAAHVVMPWHVALDAAREGQASDAAVIGTTRRGIGPAYADKAARTGIRVEHLLDPETLPDRIARALVEADVLLAHYGRDACYVGDVLDLCRRQAAFLEPLVADVGALVAAADDQGQEVLLEGAQGTLLDLDHGTYPWVTSSSPTAGGACTGIGIGPTRISRVIGVAKAYTTRVGAGPFPTELDGAVAEHLVDRGGEFGTTTGRRRRCGWIDLVALRHAVRINGITELALTKLDVLSGLDQVGVCDAYLVDGATVEQMPAAVCDVARAVPVVEQVAGWGPALGDVRSADGLPAAARAFVSRVERAVGVPVRWVGVGQDRRDVISVS